MCAEGVWGGTYRDVLPLLCRVGLLPQEVDAEGDGDEACREEGRSDQGREEQGRDPAGGPTEGGTSGGLGSFQLLSLG